MKTTSRIASILNANCLDASVVGMQTFELSTLKFVNNIDFELPTNLRLGHLAERIVSMLIRSSSNYNLLYENIQLIEDKNTLGELDFILEDIEAKQLFHMELAYKFYLYDPNLSSEEINNWIGPNRNDSLIEKLEKLKQKQFPLLYHDCTQSLLEDIEIEKISQSLCLLVSLYIPYKYKDSLSQVYKKGIKGYYLSFEKFGSIDSATKIYYIPTKTEWGKDPSDNETWIEFESVEEYIKASIKTRKSLLCWEKNEDSYLEYFIVWW